MSRLAAENYRYFKVASIATVWILTCSILIMSIVYPSFVASLAYEDGLVENLSAAFLFIAAVIFLYITYRYSRGGLYWLSGLSLLVAIVFFVLGMEEISWMQRILDIETTEYFRKNNMQREMNLHNLNSSLSNSIYYFIGFLFLIVIPFLRKQIGRVLSRVKLGELRVFLPSYWLLLAFSVTMGFVLPPERLRVVSYVAFFATLLILLYSVVKYIVKKQYVKSVLYTIAAVIVSLVMHYSVFNKGLYEIKVNIPSEYLEFFIAMGILAYSIDFLIRNFKILHKPNPDK